MASAELQSDPFFVFMLQRQWTIRPQCWHLSSTAASVTLARAATDGCCSLRLWTPTVCASQGLGLFGGNRQPTPETSQNFDLVSSSHRSAVWALPSTTTESPSRTPSEPFRGFGHLRQSDRFCEWHPHQWRRDADCVHRSGDSLHPHSASPGAVSAYFTIPPSSPARRYGEWY